MTINNVANFAPAEVESSQSLPNFSLVSPDGLLLAGTLLGLGISSTRYALWLNSPMGRRWDQQHTWFVVMLGVFLTLGWLALHDLKAALKAFAFFMISGLPIMVRALNNESDMLEKIVSRESK